MTMRDESCLKEEAVLRRNVAMGGCSAKTSRETAASDMLNRLERISDRMGVLADKTYEKLSGVMMPEPPTGESCDKAIEKCLPPLFDQARTICRRIENNIEAINNALDRTEL